MSQTIKNKRTDRNFTEVRMATNSFFYKNKKTGQSNQYGVNRFKNAGQIVKCTRKCPNKQFEHRNYYLQDAQNKFSNGIQRSTSFGLFRPKMENQAQSQFIKIKRRIKSHQKISFNIKKMNAVFKDRIENKNMSQKQKEMEKVIHSKLIKQRILKSQQNPETNLKQSQIKDVVKYQSPNQIKRIVKTQNSQSNSGKGKYFPSDVISALKYKKSKQLYLQEISNPQSIIKQIQDMRKTQHLPAQPKQWHFYNCLNFQKIQLYSTNLKLSCQGWALIDYLQLKYLRGWNSKTKDDYSPMIRLFIFQLCIKLDAEGYAQLEKCCIKINVDHVKHIPKQKRGLTNNSVITLGNLLKGVLMTDFQDLLEHIIISLGYIYLTIKKAQLNEQSERSGSKQTVELIHIPFGQLQQLKQFQSSFLFACKQMQQQLTLNYTQVSMHRRDLVLFSCPLDISLLFMLCLKSPIFFETLSERSIKFQIRFQVGWKYWQTRHQKWNNIHRSEINLNNWRGLRYKNYFNQNQCIVVHEPQQNVVLSMNDVKVNMPMRDLESVQLWYQKHIQRFIDRKIKKKDPCCQTRYRFNRSKQSQDT